MPASRPDTRSRGSPSVGRRGVVRGGAGRLRPIVPHRPHAPHAVDGRDTPRDEEGARRVRSVNGVVRVTRAVRPDFRVCRRLCGERMGKAMALPVPGEKERTRAMTSRFLVDKADTALAEMIGIVLRTEGFETVFCA